MRCDVKDVYTHIEVNMDGRPHTEVQDTILQKGKKALFSLFPIHALASF